MNPHHPGHSAAYPHHPSLSSSPHHSGPHHGYSTGGGGGGGGTTTTPDLPSPHSPPHGPAIDPATPYASLQPGQGMGSNGHHHGGAAMMADHPHHPGHPHPHLPDHPAYPPVNHNNNCTLKVSSACRRSRVLLERDFAGLNRGFSQDIWAFYVISGSFFINACLLVQRDSEVASRRSSAYS